MTKKTIILFIILFIGLVLPILGLYNCSGFNSGNMSVQSCIIDNNFSRQYADFYYGLITISSYVLFVPVLFYIGFVVFIANFISKRFFKVEFEKD